MDDLEKTEDPPVHSSRSVDPRMQSNPSADPPVNSSRSVMSTGRASSAAKKDVIDYLEKVVVDTRLGDIDKVRGILCAVLSYCVDDVCAALVA